MVEDDLKKEDTTYRRAISPAERLALTLRYLGRGDSMELLSVTYRRGHSIVYGIIHETTRVIWNKLKDN
jgi:hypothetical protein